MELLCRFNAQVEFSAPPFDKLIQTVCILARSQPLFVYLFGIPEKYQPSEDEIRGELLLQRISMSPHFLNYRDGPNSGLFLPIKDLRCLIGLEKRVKEFFAIALKHSNQA